MQLVLSCATASRLDVLPLVGNRPGCRLKPAPHLTGLVYHPLQILLHQKPAEKKEQGGSQAPRPGPLGRSRLGPCYREWPWDVCWFQRIPKGRLHVFEPGANKLPGSGSGQVLGHRRFGRHALGPQGRAGQGSLSLTQGFGPTALPACLPRESSCLLATHLTATTPREPLPPARAKQTPPIGWGKGEGGGGKPRILSLPPFTCLGIYHPPSSLVRASHARTRVQEQDGEGESRHLYGTTCSRLPRWPRSCSTCALSLSLSPQCASAQKRMDGLLHAVQREGGLPWPALPSLPRAGGALGDR